MTHISAGGYAVIKGKYERHEASFSGIVIGVGMLDGYVLRTGTKHFSNLNDPSKDYTFKVFVSDVVVIITGGHEKEEVHTVAPWDNLVWLIVQNINIENLEIHEGRQQRTK
ncbi:hypothetical protein V5799_009235 [Amblyomma americanum]|uniref:Uncharacterized protein n=1 Tax=Amblyomma americanum TaxID=6943 RepID=A0AAQ4FB18_AMBAM